MRMNGTAFSYPISMKKLFKNGTALAFGALFIAIIVAFSLCFFALSRTAAQAHRMTVVLDAGHGGIDGGVTGATTGISESEVNLAVSRYLQQEFEDAGFAVVQTRLTDAGLYGTTAPGYKKRDMQKRAQIINENSPVLVVSIHQNYFSSSSRRGAQVFYRGGSEDSYTLACLIQKSLNEMEESVKKCEPLAGDYYILNCSEYPSVIVEGGFLSNREDEALLVSAEYQKKLAKTIAEGALKFLSSAASG